ncbi:hypothetical protein BJG93_36060 [Paraburkholderia sprentiae WSM5005]|uniref:Uncharacterized protein n=1 Tax=Paraburkholderia sprentiae WSM5005 TaxID=754502 RepID=A0A8F4KIZ9_9BURK|nr:hypothetical protein [Paraburkholderia sprentiae]QXE07241.1 hypothetical protein BJG93_36060 [Paraburkholderia sprentiae WSM5005]
MVEMSFWRCHSNCRPPSGKWRFREKPAVHTVSASQANLRLQAVLEPIAQDRQKWSLPSNVRVVVSYEAGRDAFWIVRALCSRGIESYMIDAASIPVERHKRRAKTDRLDAIKLVTICAPGCMVNVTGCTSCVCRPLMTKPCVI